MNIKKIFFLLKIIFFVNLDNLKNIYEFINKWYLISLYSFFKYRIYNLFTG